MKVTFPFRPFRSGRCRKCSGTNHLCSQCLKYSDQDHGSFREHLFSMNRLIALSDKAQAEQVSDDSSDDERRQNKMKKTIDRLVKDAGLTERQSKIMKWILAQKKTFFEISEILGISRASVQTHFARALKKVRFCHTQIHIVRGTSSPNPRSIQFSYRLRDDYRRGRETKFLIAEVGHEDEP
jgi:DNA-binding CsgD family transcriptional regulator